MRGCFICLDREKGLLCDPNSQFDREFYQQLLFILYKLLDIFAYISSVLEKTL